MDHSSRYATLKSKVYIFGNILRLILGIKKVYYELVLNVFYNKRYEFFICSTTYKLGLN